MSRSLRLLFVGTPEVDAAAVKRALREAGYVLVATTSVTSVAALRDALQAHAWDIVISAWQPTADHVGRAALQIVRDLGVQLPFIAVDVVDEDAAAAAFEAGVDDFVSKHHLARLVPAIERELCELESRRRERDAVLEIMRQRGELERSTHLLRDVIDTIPYGVLVVDLAGRVLTVNAAAIELLGKPGDRLPAWIDRVQMYEPDMVTQIQGSDMPIMQAMRGIAVDRREVFLRIPSTGQDVWLSISARPLRDETGIYGAFVVFLDITSERAQQQQLLISDRMASIGMLAAGVAHELNNPLAAVLANVDLASMLVQDHPVADEHQQAELVDMLQDARSAADRVRHIVRDLKIFSRHEDTELRAVDLRQTLESAVRMAWNEIRHRATLVQDYADTPPVVGSESRLGQVFLNLVVNAAQAMPEGHATTHRLVVRTAVDASGDVVVEVSDTGTGMSPEVQRKLFTPFFTTKPPGEGTGLGLAISHRIVTGLGGTIAVDSEPGRGTTFRVTLPRAERSTTRRSVTTTAPPRTTLRRRVLVIDDETLITTAVRRLLPEHDVQTVNDARDALAILESGAHFDLILCDLMMPQMTGMELHQELVRRDQAIADRMVFMTGDAFTIAARTFLSEVPNPRIEKPFDRRVLRSLLQSA